MSTDGDCIFCHIVAGRIHSAIVFEDDVSLAFLDTRPLFPGHTLLVPRQHVETLPDLPESLVGPFFRNAQKLAVAVERAAASDGIFTANNNRVSQTVAHLHLHIVPRRYHDGLKGFFWPRRTYADQDEMDAMADAIRSAVSG